MESASGVLSMVSTEGTILRQRMEARDQRGRLEAIGQRFPEHICDQLAMATCNWIEKQSEEGTVTSSNKSIAPTRRPEGTLRPRSAIGVRRTAVGKPVRLAKRGRVAKSEMLQVLDEQLLRKTTLAWSSCSRFRCVFQGIAD